MLDTSHASQPCEGGRGTPLCGPPLRRSTEHGGSAVRAALAASPSGSSAPKNHLAYHWMGLMMAPLTRLGHCPYSKKSFSGAGKPDVTGSGLRHSPYHGKSFTKEAKLTVKLVPLN